MVKLRTVIDWISCWISKIWMATEMSERVACFENGKTRIGSTLECCVSNQTRVTSDTWRTGVWSYEPHNQTKNGSNKSVVVWPFTNQCDSNNTNKSGNCKLVQCGQRKFDIRTKLNVSVRDQIEERNGKDAWRRDYDRENAKRTADKRKTSTAPLSIKGVERKMVLVGWLNYLIN